MEESREHEATPTSMRTLGSNGSNAGHLAGEERRSTRSAAAAFGCKCKPKPATTSSSPSLLPGAAGRSW
jgi:hypothetical protein